MAIYNRRDGIQTKERDTTKARRYKKRGGRGKGNGERRKGTARDERGKMKRSGFIKKSERVKGEW